MKTLLSLFVVAAFLPLPRALSQATGSPTVYIDAPAAGVTVSGILTISGWAVDNASEVGSVISSVQVIVDGTVVGAAAYGLSRPDVCAVYPGRPGCPNVGYSYALDTSTLSVGTHTITVNVTDSDTTPDTGSSSVAVNVQDPPPAVYIDAPAPGAAASGIVTVSGWAVDNASVVGTAISGVQVKVDGSVVGTATYGISRADVCAVYPGRPGCPNVGFSYSLNTSTLSVGAHTITVTVTDSDTTPDTGSSSVTVNVQTPLPTVYIDAPASGATVSGIVAISGWAADNAAVVGAAISSVQFIVDGTVVGTATYGLSRPDVCAVYPGRPGCPNVGFSYSLNTSTLSVGSHTITVTATNSDTTPAIGSSSVTVNVQAPLPAVYIDVPASGATVSGIVAISGWAVDNASEEGTAISSVQVMVDGSVVGTATYGSSRPDVCAAYLGRPGCPNVGYSYSLNTSTLSVGSHTITVTATDSDGTPDTGFISVTVNVQASKPTVWIDAPTSGATVSGIVAISGWAVDNASEVGTAISSVQVMVDGSVVGTATYGSSRPDVCAVYPGRPSCPNVGFSYSLDTSTLTVGTHTIMVTATDSDVTPDTGSISVTVNVQAPTPTISYVSASGTNCSQTAASVGVACMLAASTATGNDVIVGLSWKTPSNSISEVVGSAPGSFFAVYAQNTDGASESASAILVCRDCPALTSITPTFSGATRYELNVAEYSGVKWLGITGINAATSTAPGLTFTTGDSNDFIVVETSSLGDAGVPTSNAGNLRESGRTGTTKNHVAGALIDNTVASAGSLTATAAITSGAWSASGVELRTAAPRTYIWPDCDSTHPCVIHYKATVALGQAADTLTSPFFMWVNPSLANNLLVLDVTYPGDDTVTIGGDSTSWTAGPVTDSTNGVATARFYICGAPAGISLIEPNISGTVTSFNVVQFSYKEISGIATSSCSDGSSIAASSAAGAMNPGSYTTTASGDFIDTFGIDASGNQENGYQSGWEMVDDTSALIWENPQDNFMESISIQAASGTINPTLYVNAMDVNQIDPRWNLVSQAFKASGGAGTQPPAGHAWVVRDVMFRNDALSTLSGTPFPNNGNAVVVVSSNPQINVDLSTLVDNQGGTYTANTVTDTTSNPQEYTACLGAGGANKDRTLFWASGVLQTPQEIYDVAGAKVSGGPAGCIGNQINNVEGRQATANNSNIVGAPTFSATLNGSAYSAVVSVVVFGAGPPSGPCVSGGVTPPNCTGDMSTVIPSFIWASGMSDSSHWSNGDGSVFYYTNSTSSKSMDYLMQNSVDQPGGGTFWDGAAVEILGQPSE